MCIACLLRCWRGAVTKTAIRVGERGVCILRTSSNQSSLLLTCLLCKLKFVMATVEFVPSPTMCVTNQFMLMEVNVYHVRFSCKLMLSVSIQTCSKALTFAMRSVLFRTSELPDSCCQLTSLQWGSADEDESYQRALDIWTVSLWCYLEGSLHMHLPCYLLSQTCCP
jgi:hypothetical protein